ncbi:hypothetical protein NL676_036995 [Syzygium grande]|nr:hypothetical protein NL676_036995 [Syzygium grande]
MVIQLGEGVDLYRGRSGEPTEGHRTAAAASERRRRVEGDAAGMGRGRSDKFVSQGLSCARRVTRVAWFRRREGDDVAGCPTRSSSSAGGAILKSFLKLIPKY